MSYIKYYENVLPGRYCHEIIQKFEDNPQQQEKTYLKDHRSFTEININKHANWTQVMNKLLDTMQDYLGHYKKDFGIDDMSWPSQLGYEQFRIKRYLPGTEDEFKFHVDVQDYASARRFLVFFWYLNTVEEGGETCFQMNRQREIELKVQPQTGRLLMFPPMWTHPHVALPPISGPKYIIGGYLHYT
jgi:hypothetical protein